MGLNRTGFARALIFFLILATSVSFVLSQSASAASAAGVTTTTSVWGGYLVNAPAASSGTLAVNTEWNVPKVTCTGSSELVDFWIFVEHEYNPDSGMMLAVTCSGTTATYVIAAYLTGSTLGGVGHSVSPGDKMQTIASVSVATGAGSLEIKDKTKGWTYSTTGSETPNTALSGYIELGVCGTPNTVVCASNGTAPMPKFTTAEFTNVEITLYAHHGSIGSFLRVSSDSVSRLLEVDSANGHVVAEPNTISKSSTGFSLMWKQGL